MSENNSKIKLWEEEPDYLEFIDTKTGYNCFIIRQRDLKHLCGYVEIPKEHNLYKEDWKNLDWDYPSIYVHGGITYSGAYNFPNYTANYVIGFDCAHLGDLIPSRLALDSTRDIYRDIGYVVNECLSLARQLKNFEWVKRDVTPKSTKKNKERLKK